MLRVPLRGECFSRVLDNEAWLPNTNHSTSGEVYNFSRLARSENLGREESFVFFGD